VEGWFCWGEGEYGSIHGCTTHHQCRRWLFSGGGAGMVERSTGLAAGGGRRWARIRQEVTAH
jgi:hypothetical protein